MQRHHRALAAVPAARVVAALTVRPVHSKVHRNAQDEYRPFRDEKRFQRLPARANARNARPQLIPAAQEKKKWSFQRIEAQNASDLHPHAVESHAVAASVFSSDLLNEGLIQSEADDFAIFRRAFQEPILKAFRRAIVVRNASQQAANREKHRASREENKGRTDQEKMRKYQFNLAANEVKDMDDPDVDYTAQGAGKQLDDMWGRGEAAMKKILREEEEVLRAKVEKLEKLEPMPWESIFPPLAAGDTTRRGGEAEIDRDTLLSMLGQGLPMEKFRAHVSQEWLNLNRARPTAVDMDDDFKAFLEEAGVPVYRFWTWHKWRQEKEDRSRVGFTDEIEADPSDYPEFWFPGQPKPILSGRMLLKLRAAGFDPRPFSPLRDTYLLKMMGSDSIEHMDPSFYRFLTYWNIDVNRFWDWSQQVLAEEIVLAERLGVVSAARLQELKNPVRDGLEIWRNMSDEQMQLKSADALIDSMLDEMRLVAGVEPRDPRVDAKYLREMEADIKLPLAREPLEGDAAQERPPAGFTGIPREEHIETQYIKKGVYGAAGGEQVDYGFKRETLDEKEKRFGEPQVNRPIKRSEPPRGVDHEHHRTLPAPRLWDMGEDWSRVSNDEGPVLKDTTVRQHRCSAQNPVCFTVTRWPHEDFQHGPLIARKVVCEIYVPSLQLPAHVEERLIDMVTCEGLKPQRYDPNTKIMRIVSQTQRHKNQNYRRTQRMVRNLIAEAWKADPDYFPADDTGLEHARRVAYRDAGEARQLSARIVAEAATGPGKFRFPPEF